LYLIFFRIQVLFEYEIDRGLLRMRTAARFVFMLFYSLILLAQIQIAILIGGPPAAAAAPQPLSLMDAVNEALAQWKVQAPLLKSFEIEEEAALYAFTVASKPTFQQYP
jgi:hypothetical protein